MTHCLKYWVHHSFIGEVPRGPPETVSMKTKRHLQNSKDLVEKLEEIEINDGEVITSFDVTILFTSMPGKAVVLDGYPESKIGSDLE